MSMTRPFARHAPRHALRGPRDEVSIADVLRVVPEQPIEALVPTFTAHPVNATGAQPVLAEPQPTGPAGDEEHPLMRALKDLRGLDFGALDEAKATPGLTYAAALADRKAPFSGFAEGVVRGLLIGALWDAFRWYRDLDGSDCGDCGEGWLCDAHIDYLALARTYETLHDFAVSALTDAAALEQVTGAVRAGGGQPRTANVGDPGSPGSPLAAVLEAALSAGGAR
jgi:hypothetical protein